MAMLGLFMVGARVSGGWGAFWVFCKVVLSEY